MERTEKGQSLIDFPKDFTAVDVETTGLDASVDELIEIAAIRIRGGKETARFETLVNPGFEISGFIEDLTGITNEELLTAPGAVECLPKFMDFVGDDVIVGHNVNFDINFIYEGLLKCGYSPIRNNFVDTLRISRRIRPDLSHHRLSDLSVEYSIPQPIAHRALADCETAVAVLDALEAEMKKRGIDIKELWKPKKKSASRVAGIIASSLDDAKPWNPLYKKQCVFTGKLESLTRKEAAQLVVNLGGLCADSVTKKTNYLVMGSNEYNPTVRDGKSNKQKKAEALILKGADLQILSESVFLEMLDE